MRKAVLAAVVAAAAVGGVILAVVLSGGSGGDAASEPSPTTGTGPQTATAGVTTRATTSGIPTRPGTTARTPTTTAAAPPPPPRGPRAKTFVVGTVDDSLAQQDPRFARSQVDVSHDTGFDAAAISAMWQRGQRRPPASLVRGLGNVSAAMRKDDMQLVVVVWHGLGRDTPQGPSDRADFAAYAGALVQSLPQIRAVIVGNEPNLSTFWKPQFGAAGSDLAARSYADLLARSYDAVKAARPAVLVLGGALSPRGGDRPGGSRPTHSPTAFIRDLGAAYRASGRDRPLMDAFAFHPYMEASEDSPNARHPDNTTITLADYPKLVALLDQAFRGTAQQGARLPVYYTEFGVQTAVPAAKRSFYSNLASPARTDSVSFDTQAAYYRRALELAYCQPTVRGLFVFHTFDEGDLGGWQSGLYFADRTPKPSLPAFKRTVADLRNGRIHCR
ncbi:MAG TPA: hypothetical protein VLK24_07285 [Gaiellaceae bacterium]|nr:hypothetical protein [Gaiellaceae bacterium]